MAWRANRLDGTAIPADRLGRDWPDVSEPRDLRGVPRAGAPDYPDKDIWWEIVERYRVTIFYTAPTAIRACMKWGEEYPAKHNLSSLRLLGTVGEPINPKAWLWYHAVIGGERCPIVDTWWQTETGAIMITTLPGLLPAKPGSAGLPLPGISAALVDESGDEVAQGSGLLALTRPWPGFLISWLVVIVALTLGSLRLPSAFTTIFALIDLALILDLAGTVNGSSGLVKAAGIVVFCFAAIGVYVFAGSLSVATGGKPLPLGRPVLA
jgi:AMP-binding enzyme/GPR1/FUN34/yaaH family